MKLGIGIGVAVLALVVLLAGAVTIWGFAIYNNMVTMQEGVNAAWSQVENVYQRRADLIPNLVATVQGYAAHESQVLREVTEARSRVGGLQAASDVISDPAKFAAFQQAQSQLSSALSRLMVVVEAYPQLKADQSFLALQAQLEGSENRITVERMRFNEAAQAYNTYIRKVPQTMIAGFGGFTAKQYFQMQAGSDVAPRVDFSAVPPVVTPVTAAPAPVAAPR